MSNSKEIPDIVSMSWGWSESQQCSITMCDNITSQQYVSRVNAEYMKLALRGLTMVSMEILVRQGTNLDCDDDSDTVYAVFPGSSPWVTSEVLYVVKSNATQNWTTPLCQQKSMLGSQEYVTNKKILVGQLVVVLVIIRYVQSMLDGKWNLLIII